jgi:hypothetical protein
MFFKRALVGLAVGLLVGSATMMIVQLYWEAKTSFQAADIGVILAVGGFFGIPGGVIIALAAGLVEYRSGLGIEWALVGAIAAILALGGLGHLEIATAVHLVVSLYADRRSGRAWRSAAVQGYQPNHAPDLRSADRLCRDRDYYRRRLWRAAGACDIGGRLSRCNMRAPFGYCILPGTNARRHIRLAHSGE